MITDIPLPTITGTLARLVDLQGARENNAAVVRQLRSYRGSRRMREFALQLGGRIILFDTSLLAAIDLELDTLNDLRNPAVTTGEFARRYVDRYLAQVAIDDEAVLIGDDLECFHRAACSTQQPRLTL